MRKTVKLTRKAQAALFLCLAPRYVRKCRKINVGGRKMIDLEWTCPGYNDIHNFAVDLSVFENGTLFDRQ